MNQNKAANELHAKSEKGFREHIWNYEDLGSSHVIA